MWPKTFVLALSCLAALIGGCSSIEASPQPSPPLGASPTSPAPAASATPTDEPVLVPGGPGSGPSDPADLMRGPFYLDDAELLILESYPYQVRLILRGSLPTPCATFEWKVEPPDSEGRIAVEVHSLQDPNLACIQILHPVEETIPLGSFTEGAFSVWLNGELMEEFEL